MLAKAALACALIAAPVLGYAPSSGPMALRAQAEPSVSRRSLLSGAGGAALAGLVTTLLPREAEAVRLPSSILPALFSHKCREGGLNVP